LGGLRAKIKNNDPPGFKRHGCLIPTSMGKSSANTI
jgi:hypothetical protein